MFFFLYLFFCCWELINCLTLRRNTVLVTVTFYPAVQLMEEGRKKIEHKPIILRVQQLHFIFINIIQN